MHSEGNHNSAWLKLKDDVRFQKATRKKHIVEIGVTEMAHDRSTCNCRDNGDLGRGNTVI